MSDKNLKKALAFAPGHITGFFEIRDEADTDLHKGSCGVGVCIALGVKTKVQLKPSRQKSIAVKINGLPAPSANVSHEVANTLLSDYEGVTVLIEHISEIPIGFGLGTSGAGALSLSLALNKVMNLNHSKCEAAQFAHLAEIRCNTGLGTVLAEYYGGLVIRIKPGAPGIGVVKKIPVNQHYRVLCLTLAKIPTEEILVDQKLRARINENGRSALRRFLAEPTIAMFLKLSREFAESIKLIPLRIRKILEATDKQGFVCSQAMFGETVFSIVKRNEVKPLLKIFREFAPFPNSILSAAISNIGAKLL